MKIKKIILYNEPSVPEIKISKLINFLKDDFPIEITVKSNFFKGLKENEIKSLAKTRIFDIYNNYQPYEVDQKQITLEKTLCEN